MKELAVLNLSTRVSTDDVRKACQAVTKQLREHVSTVWGVCPASLTTYDQPEGVPASADVLVVLNDGGQAGQLGYHSETPAGARYARVFAGPVLENKGTALNGSVSVSVVISHEACEWLLDPYATFWADGPDGVSYPLEICDPVQDRAYEIDGVSVSDFVSPSYFDGAAKAPRSFDHLGALSGPFTSTSGGWLIKRKHDSAVVSYGADVEGWRKDFSDFSLGENRAKAIRFSAFEREPADGYERRKGQGQITRPSRLLLRDAG